MKILLAKDDTNRLILELVRIKHFQGDTTIMKLKLVVASMSVLGLIGCPVLAANAATHKHHKHHVAHHDYKDMGALPYKDQCMTGEKALIMADMTHNLGRALPNPCNPGWFNRVALSGGINFDIGKWGNRDGNFMGENYQRVSLNDAYLSLSADVNEWAKAFTSLSYSSSTFNNPATVTGETIETEYSSAYANNINNASSQNIQLEQAYTTIGNLNESPFFLQFGKAFQDFGRYEIHPVTRSLTQVMSETLATALGVGFVTHGFSGQVYGFDDPITKVNNAESTTNYGASLGYNYNSDRIGFDVGAGYLYNLIGVNDIAYMVDQINASSGRGAGYHTRTGGAAVYGDVSTGPFTIGARYTASVQRFNKSDLPKDANNTTHGAKPWSAGLQAGFGFDAFGKNNNVFVGYQSSSEAQSLGLPKSRWLAGYDVNVFGRNTDIGIEWDHDSAYSTGSGGTGNHYNLVTIRSSVSHLSNHFLYPLQFAIEQGEALLPFGLLGGLLYFMTKSSTTTTSHLNAFDRDFAIYIGISPFLITLLLSCLFGITLRAGWGMPLFSLFGILILMLLKPTITRKTLHQFMCIMFFLLMGLFLGYSASLLYPTTPTSANFPGKTIANVVTQHWHERYHSPLQYVAGSRWIGGNIAHYTTDHPSVYPEWNKQHAPWIHLHNLKKQGALFVWDITHHESPPEHIKQTFPTLSDPIVLTFDWHRNLYHLKPIKIGIAYLPPQAD